MNRHSPRVFLTLTLILIAGSLLLTSCATMRALSIRNQAEKLYNEGRTAEIIPLLENALPGLKKDFGPDHDYVAECMNGLGMAYGWVVNDFEKSEDYFLQSLAIRQKKFGEEDSRTLETQRYLGLLYQVTGRQTDAERKYTDVLQILQRTVGNDHPDTAETMIMLGQLYYIRGDYAKAEQLLVEASLHEENTVSAKYPSPADALSILGGLYMMLGDLDRAEKYINEALEIRRAAFGNEHSMIALSYEALGHVEMSRNRYDQALVHFNESLRIKKKVFGERHGFLGDSYMTFSLVHFNRGSLEEALHSVDQAANLYIEVLGKDNPRYLMSRFAKGVFLYKSEKVADAKHVFTEILSAEGLDNVKELLWGTHFMYSLCLAHTKQTEAAIFFGKQAVNTIQELRSEIQSIDSALQKGYLPNRENVYKYLASLLIETGRIPEAQQIMAMLKEEEYFEYIRRNLVRLDKHTLRATYTVVEEQWSERYNNVHQELVSLGREMANLRKRKGVGSLTDLEQARLKNIRKDLKLARAVYKNFLDTLENELETMNHERIKEISSKNLNALKAMQGVLREMQGEAVLVHYLMLDDRMYIILTTEQVQVVRKVAISAPELNRKISTYRQILEDPSRSPDEAGGELYNILIRPIEQDLRQSKSTVLMLAMDGALRYLPAAALYDGKNYLIERYGLVLYTEAAKARLLSSPESSLELAGLGVSKEVPGFAALPSVKDELDAIVLQKEHDISGILPGEIYMDDQFTGDTLFDVLDRNFSVLHIASHFVFRPGTESNSYLLLGDGSRLSLATISEEDMDFNDVELLTLSACDTAVGGTGENGREIEGFGSLAQRQGAKTVIATLWAVADESTSTFMVDFYQALKNGKTNKAMALQNTQKKFIASGKYRHPFFWAPFILMGNWM